MLQLLMPHHHPIRNRVQRPMRLIINARHGLVRQSLRQRLDRVRLLQAMLERLLDRGQLGDVVSRGERAARVVGGPWC